MPSQETDSTSSPQPQASVAYKYKPIDQHMSQIQVLTLHPGTTSADIRITIHRENFTDEKTPYYEALSYTWGDPKDTALIYVGLDETKTLSVTRNLKDALRHLRLETEPRELWIDAICIDQSNLKERGIQVQRMGEMYKRADRVVVWLGPAADDSKHAIDLMKSLASKVQINWDTFAKRPSLEGADEPHWADENIKLPYDGRGWRALYSLLNRAWFQRLWVRQEIAFSRGNAIVLCGTVTVLWQDFRKSNNLLMVKPLPSGYLSDQEDIIFHRCTRHINGMARYRSSAPTWLTLRDTRFSQCSDPRDKVYGSLGFIQEAEGDIGLEPNYEWSESEVNIQLVLALLNSHKRLDMLRCCELSNEQGNMPSWTPNWSIGTVVFDCKESDAFAPSNAHYFGEGVLRVEGIVGGVLATTKIYQDSTYRDERCSEIYRIAPENVLDEASKGGSILLDSFCRTLSGGDIRDNCQDYEDYPTWQSSKDTLLKVLKTKGGWTKAHDRSFLDTIGHHGRGRCFFTTEDGKMGWAPKAAKASDYVCVILGCGVPLVLRETEKALYQVVGECYMDGIMDGELVLGVLPNNFRKEKNLDREDGMWYHRWIDTATGEVHERDPRLAKFVKEGESVDQVWIGTSWHWPFLTSERLERAGVNTASFDLV